MEVPAEGKGGRVTDRLKEAGVQRDWATTLDEWLRRRVRLSYWKMWKRPRRQIRQLIKLGTGKRSAILSGLSREGHWRLSRMLSTHTGMTNAWLAEQGVPSLKALWVIIHYPEGKLPSTVSRASDCLNRPVWTRMLWRCERVPGAVRAPSASVKAFELSGESPVQFVEKDGAAGVDRQSTEDFTEHEIDEIRRLHRQLREEAYGPRPVRRVWISKLGSSQERPLGIPTVCA